MEHRPHKPELLAPAGSLEAGLAALNAGADAVYAGLHAFNARDRAPNLSLEELSRLTGYAHRHRRCVHVTLNTLVKEQELPEVAEILAELALIGPDAIIVQDLGVLRMIRDYFPFFDVHASTQMGIHNSAGIEALARRGVKRVILQRQTTFAELAGIVSASPIEVEVFVHGALCCCRSGHCLFSSWLGGWSGNRGRCKQPCRRRFFAPTGNGFFFSSRDLCLVDHIPESRALGVTSLKIEGRLRGVDYVRTTVSAYRSVLDAPPEHAREAIREARGKLRATLGRQSCRGFRTDSDFAAMIAHTSIGGAGRMAGKIVGRTATGVVVQATCVLRRGDRVRVQPDTGEEGPIVVLSKITVDGRAVSTARPGMRCQLSLPSPLPAKGFVYRLGRQPDSAKKERELPPAKAEVNLDIQVNGGGIRVRTEWPGLEEWVFPAAFQEADRRALSPSKVVEEFLKGQCGGCRPGRIAAHVESSLFVPGAVLRQARRRFWEDAEKRLSGTALHDAADRLLRKLTDHLVRPPEPVFRSAGVTVRVSRGAANPLPGTTTCRDITDDPGPEDEILLGDFCPQERVDPLRKLVTTHLDRGHRRWRVTSLHGLELLRSRPELEITACFPLPVANSMALEELLDQGVGAATAWIELDPPARDKLADRCPGRIEVLSYGRIPLLATRGHPPVTGSFRDGRGIGFRIVRENGLTFVFPETVLECPSPNGIAGYVDLSHAAPDETETMPFNNAHPWM